ncbi:MAG TPA: PQQ-binding-like beta-propeller repeat protein [Candidatus Udaeobacter sp.]|nr:PQQ-binding-like beta-propeller repeat protein [Candidatus Udaeobacter sp.]
MKAICGMIKAFPVKEPHPHGIVYNPEGPLKGLWFDNATTDDTASVVEFDTHTGTERTHLTPTQGSQPGSINIAADHSIWFTESVANKLAMVTHDRTIKEYSVPTPEAYPLDITRGPDGAMWFVESTAGKIGRIAPDGKVQEFRTGDSASRPTALITGPDKAIWFTEVGTNRIGRLTTTGSLSHFGAGAGEMTGDITTAIDDSFWFGKKNAVTRMTASGALTEYELPNAIDTGSIFGSRNGGVFIGVMHKDGTGSVTAISADGKLKEFYLPQKHLMPIEFAQTADGSFWMTVQSFDAAASPSQLFNLPLPAVTDLPRTTIVTGGGPDWMATGAGALWIANISLKEIERIDPATNAITARIKVDGVPCSGAAFGFSSLWIPLCENDKGTSLVRIDAATNRVVATLQIAPANSEGGITSSRDSLWMATGDTELSRIDPSSGKVRQRVTVASGSQNPTYADGLVWITSKASNVLTAVDASDGQIVAKVPVPGGPHFVTTGGGAVWTIGQEDGVVTRVDPRTKRIEARIYANIPGFGGDVTYGAGYVWTTLIGVPLTKIDARTNRIVAQWYGRGGDAIHFDFGTIWLADYDHHLVWRIKP